MSTPAQVSLDMAGEYQARLAHLWEKNLGVSVGSLDDYFKSGGDSLRGTELINWIYEDFGIELSLLDIFEFRTIGAQTDLLLSKVGNGDPVTAKPVTEYCFFGPDQARLFGALHRARSNGRDSGVILCYPMGQEYMRIHRTYVELARSLADSGRHTLRFDYYGCGDSGGEATDGTLKQWTDDICQAARMLRDQTGVRKVYLVGARIGANIALTAGARVEDLAGIVLWEPVVNGVDHIATLRRAHHDLLASNAELDGYERHQLPNCIAELVGYPITNELYEELTAIDLLTAPSGTMPELLLLANSEKPLIEAYAALLRNREAKFDYVIADESDRIWLKEDRRHKGVIPARAVQAIASWLSGRNE
ncbi:MAG TPA: alpha/beta fold hydrolase [Pyrinomonadaceae bacterium]|nr:alpha/beta fold hydrolase [Pyrinomonadaceae bacterium]